MYTDTFLLDRLVLYTVAPRSNLCLGAIVDVTPTDSQRFRVLERMTLQVNRLSTDLGLWQGDYSGGGLILTDAQNLVDDMQTAASLIKATKQIGTFNAIGLLGKISTLYTAVESYTRIIIKKKPQFDATPNLTAQMLGLLQQQRQGAEVLSKAIMSKIPVLPQVVGGPFISDQIHDMLAKAVRAYGGNPRPKASRPPAGAGTPKPGGGNPVPYASGPTYVPAGPGGLPLQYPPNPRASQGSSGSQPFFEISPGQQAPKPAPAGPAPQQQTSPLPAAIPQQAPPQQAPPQQALPSKPLRYGYRPGTQHS